MPTFYYHTSDCSIQSVPFTTLDVVTFHCMALKPPCPGLRTCSNYIHIFIIHIIASSTFQRWKPSNFLTSRNSLLMSPVLFWSVLCRRAYRKALHTQHSVSGYLLMCTRRAGVSMGIGRSSSYYRHMSRFKASIWVSYGITQCWAHAG